jgi:hypothetical protein
MRLSATTVGDFGEAYAQTAESGDLVKRGVIDPTVTSKGYERLEPRASASGTGSARDETGGVGARPSGSKAYEPIE